METRRQAMNLRSLRRLGKDLLVGALAHIQSERLEELPRL
jgi:hypothetical protein